MSKVLKSYNINITNEEIPILNKKRELEQQKELEDIQNYAQKESISVERLQADILKNAQIQAEKMIDKAKKDSNTIKDEMTKKMEIEAKNTLDEAKKVGYDDGYKEGLNNFDDLKLELDKKIKDNELEYIEKLEDLEPKIMNFIIDTTKNILTNEFEFNPQLISLIIKKGLISVKQIKNITIYVSEKHFEYIENNKNDIINVDCEKNNIEIIKDSSLEDEDCLIETNMGTINCSFDMQLTAISKAIQHILKS